MGLDPPLYLAKNSERDSIKIIDYDGDSDSPVCVSGWFPCPSLSKGGVASNSKERKYNYGIQTLSHHRKSGQRYPWYFKTYAFMLYKDHRKRIPDTAKAFDVSTRTVWRWILPFRTYKPLGLKGKRDRKKAQRSQAYTVAKIREDIQLLLRWKAYYDWLNKPFQPEGIYATSRHEEPSYSKHEAPFPRPRHRLDVKIRHRSIPTYPRILHLPSLETILPHQFLEPRPP